MKDVFLEFEVKGSDQAVGAVASTLDGDLLRLVLRPDGQLLRSRFDTNLVVSGCSQNTSAK